MSCLVEKLSFFSRLDSDEISFLGALEKSESSYKARQIVYHQDEHISNMFVVKEGWAVSFSQLPNGNRTVLNIHFPGDIVATEAMPFELYPSGLMAITPATLCPFPKQGLANMFGNFPNLAALLYSVSIQERMVLVDRLKSIGRMPGKNRLMLLVLQVHARLAAFNDLKSLNFEFPLSQELIGDSIGLTTVYVNRTVRELEEDGLMSVRNREVIIFNRERMVDLCDFKDRYYNLDTSWFPRG